jgi:hypothetical protein
VICLVFTILEGSDQAAIIGVEITGFRSAIYLQRLRDLALRDSFQSVQLLGTRDVYLSCKQAVVYAYQLQLVISVEMLQNLFFCSFAT